MENIYLNHSLFQHQITWSRTPTFLSTWLSVLKVSSDIFFLMYLTDSATVKTSLLL